MRQPAAGGEAGKIMEGLRRPRGSFRAGLWLLLLFLTGALLLFPTRLTLEYEPIQSIPAIPNLPLFAALYSLWLLLLLLLLFSGGEGARWERSALVGIFALVFVGFWLLTGPNTGLRYDGIGNAAHVAYLSQQARGMIPVDHPHLRYFNFPGMHLLALALVQVTGLGLFQGVTLALTFHLVLLSVLLYILFLRSLHSPSLAAFGALLAIQGNIMLARYSFYPGIWALVFLVIFLILLHRPGQALFDTWQDRLLMLLLLGATTITHLVTAKLLFFVLAGMYLVRNWHLLRTKTGIGLVSASTLATFLVIPLAWDVYWASRFFDSLIKITSAVIEDLTEKGLLTYFFNLGQSYVGAGVPLWAIAVRYFWWGALFLFGSILGLKNLLNIKSLSRAQQLETGGLVGVIALSAAVTALSVGGSEFYRFLLYGAFCTVPILLSFVVNLPTKGRRLALGLAIPLFFLLSFPTFLAHNNLVGTSTYYPSELHAGAFLRQTTSGGRGLTLFYSALEGNLALYNVPNASLRKAAPFSQLKDASDFWHFESRAVSNFLDAGAGTEATLSAFYFSRRIVALAEHVFRIKPADARWDALNGSLAKANRVYDNSVVQIYENS
jgi:hypothetical protein